MTRTPKTPWFRKKRGSRVTRQLAQAALTDAMGAVQENRSDETAPPQPFADRCKHVRTATARKAHLLPPEGGAVLCGWPGAVYDAAPDLEVCHMCRREAEARDGIEAAS
jgi:hypothetical protein